MFSPLDDAQLEIVIDAMDSKKYNPGDSVITQGEEGSELYVVEEGTLSCFKLFVS
jgi:cAMP-dependent protein kinase regulator